MKTKHLLWAAAGLVLAGCSSEEPMQPQPDQSVGTGNLYMAVNIQDAGKTHFGAPARNTRANGDFEDGSDFEHTITSARFFFFDANGRYLTEANVWRDGDVVTDNDNVEYQGKNVLVLKNVTDKTTIKYMLTVLNAPDDLQPVENHTTLPELAAQTFDTVWRNATINGKEQKVFYMSTSSFVPDATQTAYDPNFYYANKLDESNFLTVSDDAAEINPDELTPVDVYVERLAAKVTLEGVDEPLPVTITVAGIPGNPDLGDDNPAVASQKLYIKFEKWGVSAVEPTTYLCKQLGKNQNYFNNWNEWSRFRSYWAETPQYGTEAALTYKTFNTVEYATTQAAYEKETTNTLPFITNAMGTLAHDNVASALLTASICVKDGDDYKPVDMILYQGLLYTKEQYMKYELGSLNANNKLNFYKKVNGKFVQVGVDDVNWTSDSDNANGMIVLNYSKTDNLYTLTPGADPELEGSWTAADPATLNSNLKAFNASAPAEAFNGGKMFYSIPIQHLVALDPTGLKLGNYGLVRNHWYKIQVEKVLNLGRGVFDPDEQKLKPGDDENPDKFGLAARINVLSWRIVNNKVDL